MRTIAKMSFISLSIVSLGLSACHGQPLEDVGRAALASSVPPNTVLILDGSGSGAGYEALMATGAGYNVDVVSPAVWSTKTAADFADYEAIIIGALGCSTNVHELDAAVLNPAWAAAVTGNVIVVGTDPGSHSASGADLFSRDALRFAAAGSGTGAYVSLGCYYGSAAPGTPVPALAPLGSFTVKQPAACYEDAHQVATHPWMTLIDDARLSNWHCSPRELIDGFPATFQAHVIIEDFAEPGALSFPDGALGIPYVVSRGAEPSLCGNGAIDPGEQCDDGNYVSGDGCTEECQINPMICGDWDLDQGEQCDDGNTVDGDGCSSTCQWETVPSIGACCLSGGGCQEALSPTDCTSLGGAYTADELTCSQVWNECAGLLGACCLPQGGCADAYSETFCQSAGGSYLWTGATCANDGLMCAPPPPTGGACCLPNGSCIDGVDAMKCEANQGAYFGDGTTCAVHGGECKMTVITGACCVDSGCSELTPDQCAMAGGSFAGPGSLCDQTTCPGCTDPVGACCVENQCLVLSAAACQTNGGLYAGDGSTCTTDTCGCDDDDGTAARAGCSMTAPGSSGGGGFLGMLTAALLAGMASRWRRIRMHAAR